MNSEELIVNGKSATINMEGYAKGIYFVCVEDEQKNVMNQKLIKN